VEGMHQSGLTPKSGCHAIVADVVFPRRLRTHHIRALAASLGRVLGSSRCGKKDEVEDE